ncbi:hypothetical protein AAFF_G00401160 [Aldrovandia affinis]|uniref:Homeobox domain-containing protein n=1 Tax=Aldrovandia affinis TaxID=143900 RepID=A0AAD7WKC5_9TELE|nr:hypothetical protein AAFF_G00401160 [Aldrovandia affinis]
MKGNFSIEWLSQSSHGDSGPESEAPGGPCPLAWAQDDPLASSTLSESLPGFYSSRRQGPVQLQGSPAGSQPVHRHNHGSTGTTHPGPDAHSLVSLHTNSNAPVAETGFSSSAEEEETSGYESEEGRSLSPAAPQDGPATPPTTARRPRTAFTAEQIRHLEKAFKRNAYLGTHDKAELCGKLSLSDKQIRNWFQNRRMKLKRTLQDALAQACQAKAASQLMHYSELQALRPTPYPSYYTVHESPAPYPPPSSVHYTTPPTALGSVPTTPLDSLYQCSAVPGLVLPTASAALMPQYHPYPHPY